MRFAGYRVGRIANFLLSSKICDLSEWISTLREREKKKREKKKSAGAKPGE
jgi:hypothetical protein